MPRPRRTLGNPFPYRKEWNQFRPPPPETWDLILSSPSGPPENGQPPSASEPPNQGVSPAPSGAPESGGNFKSIPSMPAGSLAMDGGGMTPSTPGSTP